MAQTAKVIRTEHEKYNGTTNITHFVKVDPEVYAAFAETGFCGFSTATEEQNIVSVATIHGGSRWQDVLHDDTLAVMEAL